MKKLISVLLIITMLSLLASCNKSIEKNEKVNIDYPNPPSSVTAPKGNGVDFDFFTSKNGYFYKNGKKTILTYIHGVNMGLTEATTDLANPNVTYDTYYDWFTKIKEMNANVVRVFSIMNPNFYNALYDFNEDNSDSPLYIIQGIWFSEDLMYELTDALESDQILISAFKRSVKETIDIIHGNSDYTKYGEFSPAIYKNDVSKYCMGYILGLEYPADFVIETNASHPTQADYTGTYLFTNNDASPFEAFLCEVGESLIKYETETYRYQAPVAFLNWQTLDTIKHSNEPFEEEDAVSVNTENILCTSSFLPGLFAAIDVYPYYPEFMNHQAEYQDYRDEDGNSDPYRAYLKDLKKQYSVPVLIAEYGLSTSRGKAHLSSCGYDQGGLTEEQQGKYCAQMSRTIAREGFCGGLLFSWQDEWFKRTWNTIMYYPDDPTNRSHNLSSAEQSYGLLSFDVSKAYPDGDFKEWNDIDYVNKTKVKVLYDAEYMNMLVELPSNFNFEKDTFYVPISVLGLGSKESKTEKLKFSDNCDFLLKINGKTNTRLLCDDYLDVYKYKYFVQKNVMGTAKELQKNSGKYNPINTFVSNEMYLPDDDKTIPPKAYESGVLRYGKANPDSNNYCSQADFYYKDGKVEIRLAWYLLNVANARLGICIDKLDTPEIQFTNFDDIKVGGGENGEIQMSKTYFEAPKNLKIKERLKSSYYSIKDVFSEIKKAIS